MTKTIGLLTLTTALLAASATDARAQAQQPETNWFGSLSVGAQVQSRTIGNSTNIALYNELATVTSSQKVGAGFLGDINAGRRVWRNVSVAVGLWVFHSSGTSAPFRASVPDPLVFNNPTIVTGTASGLHQTDLGIDIDVMYTHSLSSKTDISVFGGPSIIHVKQDFASIDASAGPQNATGASVSESKTTGKAGNGGIDLTYHLNDRYSAMFLVRYAGGEVDLPSSPKMKIGGAQVGVGLRVGF